MQVFRLFIDQVCKIFQRIPRCTVEKKYANRHAQGRRMSGRTI